MAETKTTKQLEFEWWQAWWAEDFSWEGLAKKPIQGWVVADRFLRETETGRIYGQPRPEAPMQVMGRVATLQDYWRTDPATGCLRQDEEMVLEWVEEPGQPRFHRIHLPLTFRDGNATGKASWPDDALDSMIATRLSAATQTKWIGERGFARMIEGPDGRARLDGAILLSGVRHPEGYATPISAAYDRTAFGRAARFEGVTFSADAHFKSAHFFGDTSFWGATFSEGAGFEGSTFSGDASFDSATFSGNASFGEATFSGYASFGEATFSGKADFEKATFLGYASFSQASFSEDAWFVEAIFSGDASFWRAAFLAYASFGEATFLGDPSFLETTFHGNSGFSNATFSGNASFGRATFSGNASFEGATFSRDARFWGATFRRGMSFFGAAFEMTPGFRGISAWPAVPRDWHRAFDQAVFRGTLDLTGLGFRALAAFDGATLERGLKFDEVNESEANAVFRRELNGAIAAAAIDADEFEKKTNRRSEMEAKKSNTKPVLSPRREKKAYEADQREARLRELERGCRVLKQAMERSSNKTREQLFYRFELRARRAQRHLPIGEKTFSYLYAFASDYGASMWRPFAALVGLIFAFAALFYAWSFGFSPGALFADGGAGAVQALDLSWRNVFRPFSALSTEVDYSASNPLAARLLYDACGAVDGQGFGVRAVATSQSMLALVLAFLFALAVRRRFQIS